MTSAAVVTFGTTLTRASNVIAELTTIGSPKLKQSTVDVTNMQSPAAYEEFIGGILSGGSVNLDGNFIGSDTNGQIGLVTDMNAGTVQAFVITFPASTGTTFTFNALVESFEVDDAKAKDTKLGFKASLKITGQPVLAVATSTGLTTPFFTLNNSATLVPAASGSVTSYVSTVLTGVTSIIITPTAAAGVITITAGGTSQTVATGVAASAITLGGAGSVTPITISVKETNKAAKTYTVNLARA
ncbi:MAG TPA: phage tail tube protein [Symbiobacteriaceae bacterium]|jgi:hypothetical protein